METLLLVWINEKQMAGDSVSAAIIIEKAKQLFEELGAKAPCTNTILLVHIFLILYYIFPVSVVVVGGNFALGCGPATDYSYIVHIFRCMLERTDAITNKVLEPNAFVLTYPTIVAGNLMKVDMQMA